MPSPHRFALTSEHVVTPEGTGPATILVENGSIVDVLDSKDLSGSWDVTDFGDLVIGPGLVDLHVHINEPGRTEWEGFDTGTRAAIAGGITTIVDMPLNSSPVTIDAESLKTKIAAAEGKCWCDVGFYGGLVPGNPSKIPELISSGVLGIKAFLCDSGLPEFPAATEAELRAVMPLLAASQIPLLVHAEITNTPAPPVQDPRSFRQFVESRPGSWELEAIQLLLRLIDEFACPIHIVHLANADPLVINLLNDTKRAGFPLTVETCPHYLYFAAEDIPDGDPRYKCAPPIRSRANRENLQQALAHRVVDTIGSDHSPCPVAMKNLVSGNVRDAWGGIAGIQFMLPAVWTSMRQNAVNLDDIFRWLAMKPAQVVGLENVKGEISIGCDADLVIWDRNACFEVSKTDILHRNQTSPYEGEQLFGKVHRTYLRGQLVYDAGMFADAPTGEILRR